MENGFFAMLSRMKYINRWALMRNTHSENLSEHSLEVAAIAHALAVIENTCYGGKLDAGRAAVLGIYHDMPEIITGDMPTPIKHGYPEVEQAYKQVEQSASASLVAMLPGELQGEYRDIFFGTGDDEQLRAIVKAADKICALTKCIEEEKAGNSEFSSALKSTAKGLEESPLMCVKRFMSDFLSAYGLTLDELQK